MRMKVVDAVWLDFSRILLESVQHTGAAAWIKPFWQLAVWIECASLHKTNQGADGILQGRCHGDRPVMTIKRLPNARHLGPCDLTTTSRDFMNDESADETKPTPVPLSASARRVLGVLVEKAKTTPDNYPLTLSGIVTGSNQKSNRDPKMDLDDEDALLALDELRRLGAAREVQGSGRAIKYRHAAYEWLDVDGPGSAVMTELLLRGPQTLGELRTRASRMHPFPDLNAIKSVVSGLAEKGLVESLTPPGRGQTFSHTLYPPQERQFLNAKIEKQNATKSPAVASESVDANRTAVDQLLDRLETVNNRIDTLEKRLAELENSNSSE